MSRFYMFILISLVSLAIAAERPLGVVDFEPQQTDPSYRLISSRNLQAAHLLRPDGRYIHSWYFPYTEPLTSSFGGFGKSWHYAEMLPNGNLVAIIKDEAILELDWQSELVWSAQLRAHHDFARTANGHTIVVSRQDVPHLEKEGETLAIDELVEYNAEGEIVWRWEFQDHMDELAALVDLPEINTFRDWPHINTLEILPENPLGQTDSRFRAGNLLLCGRHANAIFIIDRESEEIVWAWGPVELLGPHMPTMLENGNLLIYDNGHHTAETSRGYTRIIELDPIQESIEWQYTASPNSTFFSPSRGSANRLPNGNTLIAESDSGHTFEITPNGTVVWEYWNSDVRENGRRMPLYRVVPYSESHVQSLIDQYGIVQDVIPEHEEDLEYQRFGPNVQYKRFIREVVFYAELGYFDHALKFLDLFMSEYPNDPEGYYGYSVVYSAKKHPERAFEYMKKALDAGLPLDRFTCGLTDILSPLLKSDAFIEYVRLHAREPVHGPTLGDLTPTGANIWLRTLKPLPVQVIARQQGDIDFTLRSQVKTSSAEHENTAIVTLEGLEPNTTYEYRVRIDGYENETVHHLTTAPEKGQPAHFKTAFGGGAGFTPKYEHMWDTIHSHDLPFFLLLGDNVYIDHPERPGVQQYCYYRRQSRPEFRRFAGNTALYAIWDDHDFTFNDGKGSPYVDDPAWKVDVWRLFKNQWNNPYYGGGEEQPGCWFDFSYGDVDFMMLDCRYYREVPDGNPAASMLGDAQKQWLLEKLKNSTATFKVIASSVPWAKGTKPGSLDTWDGHPQEREEIFSFIEDNQIEGVVLISADRHRSDAWRIERPDGYDFYEFESSKLTNIHTHRIMPGALFGYNKTCSFGLLEFDTTRDDPQVTYRVFSIDNEEIHRLTVYKSQLSFEE